jgi:diguanylate cyclase (GGDEF)-like protein
MSRVVRYLLPILVGVDIVWRLLSPSESTTRDLFLYNAIWVIALGFVISSPLSIDRVAVAAISLAISVWGIGSLLTSIDEFTEGGERFSLPTQILYCLFYPLLLIAIPRLTAATTRLRPIELLDSLIFGLGFTSIIATLLLVAIFPAETLLTSGNYFAIFYPVGDLSLLLISVTTLITKGFKVQLLFFAIGVSIFAASDIYYLWLSLDNRYTFGNIADTGWLIAIMIIALALSIESHSSGAITPIHPALVALSIFISPVLLAISALRPNIFPIYIVAPSVANLLLAFIRMSTTLREARLLGDERVLARTDELTGLANRRKLIAELDNFSHVEGALLLLDLDGFKPVNDQYGHEVGDLILRQVAQRFSRTVPASSLIARLGGDEFGILLHGSTDETLEIAHALRAALSYPFTIHGEKISVGVSVGIAQNDGAGDLMRRADSAMYRAKQLDVGVAQP